MGAASHVTEGMVRRGVHPAALWFGILAGPMAWAAVHTIKYAAARWACAKEHLGVLHLLNAGAFVVIVAALAVSWAALQRTPHDETSDGGGPFGIARFMALLGLASSSLFIIVMLANAVPQWMLDACR